MRCKQVSRVEVLSPGSFIGTFSTRSKTNSVKAIPVSVVPPTALPCPAAWLLCPLLAWLAERRAAVHVQAALPNCTHPPHPTALCPGPLRAIGGPGLRPCELARSQREAHHHLLWVCVTKRLSNVWCLVYAMQAGTSQSVSGRRALPSSISR